jgi:hypothetical protein
MRDVSRGATTSQWPLPSRDNRTVVCRSNIACGTVRKVLHRSNFEIDFRPTKKRQ